MFIVLLSFLSEELKNCSLENENIQKRGGEWGLNARWGNRPWGS